LAAPAELVAGALHRLRRGLAHGHGRIFSIAFIGMGLPWPTWAMGDLAVKLAFALFCLAPYRLLMDRIGPALGSCAGLVPWSVSPAVNHHRLLWEIRRSPPTVADPSGKACL